MKMKQTRCRVGAVGVAATTIGLFAGAGLADCQPAWDENVGNPGLTAPGPGSGQYVSSFAAFDAGDGEQLYAAGGFTNPGNRVARWDGEQWHSVGFNLSNSGWINDMAVFDGHLYVGDADGINGRLARYDGQSWEVPGGGVYNTEGLPNVWSMAVYDDGNGPVLYVGGRFNRAGGPDGIAVNNIARWDGERWEEVGGGLSGAAAFGDLVQSMVVWNGSLYASGRFTMAGSTSVLNLARWDGNEWHDVGGGLSSSGISDMTVWDDGSGEALYLTGNTMTGPVVSNVVRWDGQQFSAPGGGGPTGWGRGLAVFDDGDGEKLYAMGGITGQDYVMLSRWDGQQWEEHPDRLYDGSSALAGFVWDDGHGEALFVGGSFERSDSGVLSSFVAAWRGCPVCIADWNGDGEVDINDFFAYLSDFEDGDPRADLNNDGEIDINDFFIFLSEFEAGC